MKIIGASCVTENDVAVPEGATAPMALDYALDAALQALAQAQRRPDEVELVVALSISPSRLADDPGYSYPRLSHPVQRDLGLDNAVVFDLMDADWALALDLAQSFCRGMGYRCALVFRGECVDDVAEAHGHALVNGAGAIVIACGEEDTAFFAHSQLDMPPLLVLRSLDWREIRETGRYAEAVGAFDAAEGRFSSAADAFAGSVSALIGELPADIPEHARLFFCERWMGPALDSDPAARPDATLRPQESDRDVDTPPMFELPRVLRGLLQTRAQDGLSPPCTLVAFTLDPFKSRIGCFAVEV